MDRLLKLTLVNGSVFVYISQFAWNMDQKRMTDFYISND